MLASRTWHHWANDKERLWMNFWNMSISFEDRLTSKTIFPSSKLGSNESQSIKGFAWRLVAKATRPGSAFFNG
jgi:hypothetical protein